LGPTKPLHTGDTLLVKSREMTGRAQTGRRGRMRTGRKRKQSNVREYGIEREGRVDGEMIFKGTG